MNLKNNGYKQFITNIILVNLAGITLLLFLIVGYLEIKSSNYLYGFFFLLLLVILLDVLFFLLGKDSLSKVLIEDGKIKEKFFKKTLKEININDIKLLFVDTDILCVSSKEFEIKFIKQLYPIVRNKSTILFRMNLEKLPEIFEPMKLGFCYTSNRVEVELKEKLKKYFSIIELE